jgi:Flp pilus assembly protein TadB
MLDRKLYLIARGRNWIVFGLAFAVLASVLFAVGNPGAAVMPTLLALVSVPGFRRAVRRLRQLQDEGRMDRSWPVV